MSDAAAPVAPDDAGTRWLRHMRRGEMARAWAVCDEVLRARAGAPCWHLPRHLQWIWDGTPLDGKRVLVRCYHGLGDTIQLVRYAPRLRAVAAEVTWWAQPRLIPLLRTAPGVDRLLPLHDGTPEAAYDVDVESMELPHVFRTTLETIPLDVPYLRADPTPIARGESLAVGISWRGGGWDARRSVPFPLLAPLLGMPGVAWWSLQRDAAADERHPALHRAPEIDTIEGTASLARALDLVIAVDSMPAHLAGALGVPTWTLLPEEADWRWMERREDSPWYPTMRLVRQRRAGRWEEVIGRVRAMLEARRDAAPRA